MRLIASFLLAVVSAASIKAAAFEVPPAEVGIRFADSEMVRFPEVWQLDHGTRYVWGYAQGLGAKAMLEVWKHTGDGRYYNYVLRWADHMVRDDGSILNYRTADYNIDFINAGKILFDVHRITGEEKYRMALDTLLSQLATHPKTSDGVFWHKLIYPHQIWLDGIYMAGPFMARYGAEYDVPELTDLAVHEAIATFKHTLDRETGLLYHAYDESREQRWSDPETGQSPHFWGRAIGWYFMAVVDILDFVPPDHIGRESLVAIIRHLADVMPRYQDADGLWYQIVDMAGREGNYSEASVTTMMMYSLAKSVNRGYLSEENIEPAWKAYNGLMNNLINTLPDGTLSLRNCCAVAGLGGTPYRDGSYGYYISAPVRDNDAKATGPFIMGCLELGKWLESGSEGR